jgi:hypothetical protein
MAQKVRGSNLGLRIGTFRGLGIGLRTWVFIFLPWGLVTLFLLVYGTLLARNAYLEHGPSSALLEVRKWYLLATTLLTLIGLYLLYRLLISWRKIDVFEDGLMYRLFALRHRSYHWYEITGIATFAKIFTVMEKELQTIPGGTIFTNTGYRIPLTNRIQNIPRLVELVKSKVYPRIWPKLLADYQSGKVICFGRISICSKYLDISKHQIAWNSILRLNVRSGYLIIESRDQHNYKIPIATIPNLELLLKLVEWDSNP